MTDVRALECVRAPSERAVVDAAVARLAVNVAQQKETMLESFLVSGAMPRDLACEEGPSELRRLPVLHLDVVARFGLVQPWRIL
jgi:hypothetical protein